MLKERHAILLDVWAEYAPPYAAVKIWVAHFKRGEFSACAAPRPWWLITVTTPGVIDQIDEITLEKRRIRAKPKAEQGHLTLAGWFHHSWRFRHTEVLREVCPEKSECGTKTSAVRVVWANFGILSGRPKWFPVAIVDHKWNLVISHWIVDNAAICGMAA